jgi:hypothetical protein
MWRGCVHHWNISESVTASLKPCSNCNCQFVTASTCHSNSVGLFVQVEVVRSKQAFWEKTRAQFNLVDHTSVIVTICGWKSTGSTSGLLLQASLSKYRVRQKSGNGSLPYFNVGYCGSLGSSQRLNWIVVVALTHWSLFIYVQVACVKCLLTVTGTSTGTVTKL